jgi:hypothetical protein
MRKLLLASAFVATPLLAAHANLQIQVTEDAGLPTAVTVVSGITTNGINNFSSATGLPDFSNISISASGVPVQNNPDLATTEVSAATATSFTGSHTLTVDVFQTALTSIDVPLSSTFTVNNLIGSGTFAGPSTLSDFTGGTGTGLGTLLHTVTFPAEASGAPPPFGPTSVGAITSDAQQFVVTFTGAGQTTTDTIQTTDAPVPEPATFALLATGLVALAITRRRAPD